MRKLLAKVSLIEMLVVLGILVVLSVALLAPCVRAFGGVNIEYSDGSRSGMVQKLSKKGVIWKTWEGEMYLGHNKSVGTDNGTTIVPEMFRFSVSSDEVATEIKKAETSGDRVTLEYKQYILRGFDKGKTSYDIVGVEVPQ